MARWQARAAAIPDRSLREDALTSIAHKRDHAEGAALFWVLLNRRDHRLLRLLVAYQTIWDFLDNVSEHDTDETDARQLHRALVEALDPETPISDYYRHHSYKNDGGYLRELVNACRAGCMALPSYALVRPHVLAAAALSTVQSINHDPDPVRRDTTLRAWAEREAPEERAMTWFELAAAASACVPHPFLCLAAESSCTEADVAETLTAYFPWVSLAIAMLDSYADQLDDSASGNHSYISHYGDVDLAVRRVCEVVERAAHGVQGLRNGCRHVVLIACMVAMYLSRDGTHAPDLRARTQTLASAGGSLTRLLLPVARAWRSAYLQRAEPSTPTRPSRRARRSELPPSFPLPPAAQTLAIWRSPHACLEHGRRRYGKRFTIITTSRPPLVCLSGLDDIRAVLTAPAGALDPGEGADTIEPLVGGESFMLRDGQAHIDGRRAILAPLHAKAVRAHTDLVADVVRREVDSWPRDVPFALHPRLRAMTLETILRVSLGASKGFADRRLYELRDRLLAMLSITASAVYPEPLLRHGPGRRLWARFLRDRAQVDELIYEIVAERADHGDDGEHLLGRLLRMRNADGSPASPRQVHDNLMSVILAGHETTAAELAWAFQLLAHNPRVLERLTEEIREDAGDEYLTATIYEVLRHRPVFLFAIPRAVKQPIEIGGWRYRPPSRLVVCIYLLHHDPEIYPEPQEFRPERFIGAPPAAPLWLPWGGGRKRCPGAHLSMLEMKTVLRTTLQRMTIAPASRRLEHPRWRSVIVTPHAGSRVVLQRRKSSCAGAKRGLAKR